MANIPIHPITPNFSYEEFFASDIATSKGIINIPQTLANTIAVSSNLVRLALLLQRIRDILGIPLRVTSGYRCPDLNKQVKGVANSYHCIGAAADIKCANMAKLKSTLDYLSHLLQLEGKPIFKLVIEPTWYHLQLSSAALSISTSDFIKLVNE